MFDNALDKITRDPLKKFGIKSCNTVVKKLTQRGFPAAEERTVIILTQGKETDTTRWQEAVDCINEIIKDAAAQAGKKMGVELENPAKKYYDISSAISPGTSVHKSFLQIEHVVEAEMKDLCSGLWTSIAYHNRYSKFSGDVGFEELTPVEFVEQPTVIVFVAPGSLAHWGEVETQIRRAIEAVPFEEDVEIALEILPGFNTPSTRPSTADTLTTSKHPKYLHDIGPFPTLGASISPQLSDTDSGSLGAVVNFQPRGGGEPQKCFLTSYHAVASGDPIGRAVNDEFGIGLDGRAVGRRIEIAYPACCDGEYTKELLAKLAAEDPDTTRLYYAGLVALIEREGVVGEVIHASGLRYSSSEDTRHRMDWALVALHPPKDEVLNLPPTQFQRQCSNEFEFIFNYRMKPGKVISETSEPVAFSWAGKVDGGTWGTAGRVNSMKRTVCWGDGVVSKEIEVIPFKGQFAKGGDDGSMVFNVKKEWVGMVVGSDSEYAGYVTPAADIIADIEARTGGTITLV